MINKCKKCGSKNLYLEPKIKGQDILSADMVALKCKDCGSWLKWCPKDERKYYVHNTLKKDKWQKLKEFLNEDKLFYLFKEEFVDGYKNCLLSIKNKMQELEVEDVED